MEITINIEAEVNPTESEDKVSKSLFNLFGELKIEACFSHKGTVFTAQTNDQGALNTLRSILSRDRIRDAARKVLHEGMKSNQLTFYLNKQVAFAGHISFSEAEAESPLGPIKIIINCENPLELINWLAPRTSKY